MKATLDKAEKERREKRLYERLAWDMMSVGVRVEPGCAPEGFEYRKGKTAAHAQAAYARGMKNGRGKTEYEISFIGLALKTVFKLKKGEQ